MKLLLLIITSMFLLSDSVEKICFEQFPNIPPPCYPDYYWRDYNGQISEDAVEGGRSPSGKPFYISQAYFKDYELLPATIFPGKSYAVASAYNTTLKAHKHVKILCSKHNNYFKWISIESKDLNKLTNTHIVIGGSEIGQTLYIGRVFDESSVKLGKIFKHSLGNRGIGVPSNGHAANYLSYDILTYSCEDKSLNSPFAE